MLPLWTLEFMSNSQILAIGSSFSFGSSLGTSSSIPDFSFNISSPLISSPLSSLTSSVEGLGLSSPLPHMSIYRPSTLSGPQMSRTLTVSPTDCSLWFWSFGSELVELGGILTKELKTCSSVRPVSTIRTGALGGGTF